MEYADAFTDNIGIELMSHIENGEAEQAIKNVQAYTETFQAALDKYNGYVKTHENIGVSGEIDIDDTWDILLDVVDAFDFMSFVMIDKLSDAYDQMENLQSKVHDIYRSLESNFTKAKANVDIYQSEVINMCLDDKDFFNY